MRRSPHALSLAAAGILLVLGWRESAPNTLRGRAASPVQGVRLIALRAEHPDHRRVRGMLDQLGIDLKVTRGPGLR